MHEPQGSKFSHLILRIWKGLLLGASEESIRQQLESEGIGSASITLALSRARRSPLVGERT